MKYLKYYENKSNIMKEKKIEEYLELKKNIGEFNL